ncbi:MAG TPA: hypothetical protein VHZ55_11990, partial [Bryobacteraceae bacterium]|nr:hypothetical protein [Bryobacteraceae bacterium]
MKSDLKQTSPYRDGYRMGTIIGPQLVHEILDVEIDGGLRNGQMIGNLFVTVAVSNEPKDFQFSGRKIVVAQMLGKAGGYFRWDVPIAGMNRPNHRQQFILRHA